MVLRKVLLLSFVVALCATAPAFAAVGDVWDAASQLTGTNPSGAWTYASAVNVDPGYVITNFSAYLSFPEYNYWISSSTVTAYGYILSATGTGGAPWNFVGLGMCPGDATGGTFKYSVLRWTAPAAGSYQVYTGLEEIDWGDVDIHVLVNGTEVFNHYKPDYTPGLTEFTGSASLQAGGTIDVALGCGDYYKNDWMKGKVTITEVVPEPSSILAFGSGLVGLAGMAIRRRRS